MKIGFIGLGIMGRPMALNLKAAGHELFIPDRRSLVPELRAAATVLADAASVAEHSEVVILMVPRHARCRTRAVWRSRRLRGAAEGQPGHRHVVDQSDRHPQIRRAHRQARLRLSRRAGLWRRGRRQGGQPDHHGRRSRCGLRPRAAAVRADGQEHHPCRRGAGLRPGHQGLQPDHRGAEHPGGQRGADLRRQGGGPIRRRCARR